VVLPRVFQGPRLGFRSRSRRRVLARGRSLVKTRHRRSRPRRSEPNPLSDCLDRLFRQLAARGHLQFAPLPEGEDHGAPLGVSHDDDRAGVASSHERVAAVEAEACLLLLRAVAAKAALGEHGAHAGLEKLGGFWRIACCGSGAGDDPDRDEHPTHLPGGRCILETAPSASASNGSQLRSPGAARLRRQGRSPRGRPSGVCKNQQRVAYVSPACRSRSSSVQCCGRARRGGVLRGDFTRLPCLPGPGAENVVLERERGPPDGWRSRASRQGGQ
jgi:hypothetical protein